MVTTQDNLPDVPLRPLADMVHQAEDIENTTVRYNNMIIEICLQNTQSSYLHQGHMYIVGLLETSIR